MQVVARRHEDDLCVARRRAHGARPPLAQARPRLQLSPTSFRCDVAGALSARELGAESEGWGGGSLGS